MKPYPETQLWQPHQRQNVSLTAERIERVALALYNRTRAKQFGGWREFEMGHPSIAKIYRENAKCALEADATQ